MSTICAKSRLSVTDLYGETLFLAKRNDTPAADRARYFLERFHPQVQIEDIVSDGLQTFNDLASSSKLALSGIFWENVHPLLTTIPVDWDFTIPYGLIYAKNPSQKVLDFIDILDNLIKEEKKTPESL